jgi:iron(III) transport system ATP-binding protein
MTVFDNVAFPLTLGREPRLDREQIAAAVAEALAFVDMSGFETRPATRLSGGQQQRVALARALVRKPKLLLLDEPLSNLDASLREEMRTELREMQRRAGITMVYVTHDQSEALAMSDQIAVLSAGRIIQVGSPHQIYFEPRSEFVARFVGNANLVRGRAEDGGEPGRNNIVTLEGGATLCARFTQDIPRGSDVLLSFRQECIRLDGALPQGDGSSLSATIKSASFLGSTTRYDLQVGSVSFRAALPSVPPHAVGDAVHLSIAASDILVLRPAVS